MEGMFLKDILYCMVIIHGFIPLSMMETTNLDELRFIFSPPNIYSEDLTCIKVSGMQVSEVLKSSKYQNVTKLCTLLNGTIHKDQMVDINTVDLNVLRDLNNLEELWMLPEYIPGTVPVIYDTYLRFNESYENKLNLSRLHIHIPLHSGYKTVDTLKSLLSSCSLEVLDLRGVIFASNFKNIQILLQQMDTSLLKALALSAVQAKPSYCTALNITSVFHSLQNHSLEYLDLSNNFIKSIHGRFTRIFPRMRILDLSGNKLLHNLAEHGLVMDIIFFHPTIEIVNFRNDENEINTAALYDGKKHGNKHKRAIELNTLPSIKHAKNQKKTVQSSTLLGNKKGNVFQFLKNQMGKANVTSINQLLDKKIFCKLLNEIFISHYEGESLFPCKVLPSFQELITSYLDHSGECSFGILFPISPNLMEIYISHLYQFNYASGRDQLYTGHPVICVQKNVFTKLSFVDSASFLNHKLNSPTFIDNYKLAGFSSIEMIDESFNRQKISLFSEFLKSFSTVKSLNIAGNYLSVEGETLLSTYFPEIENLDISYCNLTSYSTPISLLINSTRLTHLNMAGNGFTLFELRFYSLAQLTKLNISSNDIEAFGTDTVNDFKTAHPRKNKLEIDLSANHLLCGCSDEEIATLDLIHNSAAYDIDFISKYLYTCYYGNSYTLVMNINLKKHKTACKYPHLVLILTTTLSNIFLVVMFMLAIILYKFRYRIFTNCLRIKNKLLRSTKNHERRYEYDAFISYCAEDRFWVHGTLVKELEVKYGFRLCIHYRDFMIGNDIVDEIIRAISISKAVIVVLSENSLMSNWCDYELKAAHRQSVETNCKLLVIKLGRIDTKSDRICPFVQQLLESKVYTSWPEEYRDGNGNKITDEQQQARKKHRKIIVDKKVLFWTQISSVLYDKDASCKGCCLWGHFGHDKLESVSEETQSIDQQLQERYICIADVDMISV